MSVPSVRSAIGHLLQRPPSPHPPLLQPRSVSHNLWYNYGGRSRSSGCNLILRQDVTYVH